MAPAKHDSGRLHVLLCALPLFSACAVSLDLPESAQVACAQDADCPEARVCVVELGQCVAPGTACVEKRGSVYAPAPDGDRCALGSDDGVCIGATCVTSICGDSVVDTTRLEQCDDGGANNDFAPDACRVDCVLPACGDEVVDTGEICDDGNTQNGDGCRGDCLKEERCGDGTPDAGETCDDSNTQSGDGCRADCLKWEVCGDLVVDFGEACDDNNTQSGDGCRGDCLKEERCGDNAVDANETCDDANVNDNDGCAGCQLTTWTAQVRIGSGQAVAGLLSFSFLAPRGVVTDLNGVTYVSDAAHTVWRVDTAVQAVARVAGNGTFGFSGDGGPAPAAQLFAPAGMGVDTRGNLYIADQSNHRVRRVDAITGIITTVAGAGSPCNSLVAVPDPCGDGGPATLARLNRPAGVAVASNGDLYIADTGSHRIRRVTAQDGLIATLAGTGEPCTPTTDPCGDDASPALARLYSPEAVALGPNHELYIADSSNLRLRRILLNVKPLTITHFAGTVGVFCPATTDACGDGGDATAALLRRPVGLAVDAGGSLLVADEQMHRVRRVDVTAIPPRIDTIAGSGVACGAATLPCGDMGPAVAAELNTPRAVAVHPSGSVLIADSSNNRLRRVESGDIATLAGSGWLGNNGDGGAALAGVLSLPRGLAIDAAGDLLIADQFAHVVRRVEWTTQLISSAVGAGAACPSPTDPCGDGLGAASALLSPGDVAADAAGNLYLSVPPTRRVRRVDTSGTVSTIAGDGNSCSDPVSVSACGDGGPAAAAQLGINLGVAVRGSTLYLTHLTSPRVRAVDLAAMPPTITTVVGDGSTCADPLAACGTDGGDPAAAQLIAPHALAFDTSGNLYVSDPGLSRILKIDLPAASPRVVTVAGYGNPCFAGLSCGDGNQALAADLSPRGLAVDDADNVYFADYGGNRIRRIDATNGLIEAVVGSGAQGFAGDGGPALAALLNSPEDVMVVAGGDLLISDSGNRAIRMAPAVGNIFTVVGAAPLGDGPSAAAHLTGPQGVAAMPVSTTWLVADGRSNRVRRMILPAARLDTVVGYPGGYDTGADPLSRAMFHRVLNDVAGIAADAVNGIVYVTARTEHAIFRVDLVEPQDPLTWTIDLFAGVPQTVGGFDHPSDPKQSTFMFPRGLAYDVQSQTLYVADTGNHTVRAVDTLGGATSTVAGQPGTPGFYGEDVPATDAYFDGPTGLTVALGQLYIADTGNHRVRRVDLATGTVSTVIGDGIAASSGHGPPALALPIDRPQGLAVDGFGNLFATSRTALRVVVAGDNGYADGWDTAFSVFGQAPRTTFPSSVAQCLSAVAAAPGDASILVFDGCQGYVIELTRTP